MRKDSVDYVLHLGDYIYEYKNGDYGWGNSLGRIPLPDREIVSYGLSSRRLVTVADKKKAYMTIVNG